MMDKANRIWESLRDGEYRNDWASEHVDVGLAFQIRALRITQEWSQTALGEQVDTPQSVVSNWEKPNYGKYSLRTLKKLANAFGVGLLVRFVPFSELVDWTANVTPARLAPLSFQEEDAKKEAAVISKIGGLLRPYQGEFFVPSETSGVVLSMEAFRVSRGSATLVEPLMTQPSTDNTGGTVGYGRS